jgi:hypothetical protein
MWRNFSRGVTKAFEESHLNGSRSQLSANARNKDNAADLARFHTFLDFGKQG